MHLTVNHFWKSDHCFLNRIAHSATTTAPCTIDTFMIPAAVDAHASLKPLPCWTQVVIIFVSSLDPDEMSHNAVSHQDPKLFAVKTIVQNHENSKSSILTIYCRQQIHHVNHHHREEGRKHYHQRCCCNPLHETAVVQHANMHVSRCVCQCSLNDDHYTMFSTGNNQYQHCTTF